jgi:DNA-directed RNA polymerase specialized sigma24 family protein
VYTRYEHGNHPVRVFVNPESGDTNYELQKPEAPKVFTTARGLFKELYGHDVHMPFDRYFRLGKYRQSGRASGSANLLTLLDGGKARTKRTKISVHAAPKSVSGGMKQTKISFSPEENRGILSSEVQKLKPKPKKSRKLKDDPEVQEFLEALRGEMGPLEAQMQPTPEMIQGYEKALTLAMDRLEERVGIDLGARGHEVRKLLFAGFAGKMMSRGYDPEEVLQEIYAGFLVRNKGTCPWDIRKSSFGHYVHMVISCVLTNYHRKQNRRIDRDSVPLGDEAADIGQWGSCKIYNGSEIGDEQAFEKLHEYFQGLPDTSVEAVLGREILHLVVAGYRRSEIARATGKRPSLVSRALAWVRKETAIWASENYLAGFVPRKYILQGA